MISGTRYRLTMEINRQTALAGDIAHSQTEISTGKRIQAPSDDPVAAARISSIARTQANDTAFASNLNLASALAARALADPTARAAALAASADNVGAAVAHVASARGAQGALGSRIDQLTERQAGSGLQLQEERSNLESTDVTATIAKLQSQQLT